MGFCTTIMNFEMEKNTFFSVAKGYWCGSLVAMFIHSIRVITNSEFHSVSKCQCILQCSPKFVIRHTACFIQSLMIFIVQAIKAELPEPVTSHRTELVCKSTSLGPWSLSGVHRFFVLFGVLVRLYGQLHYVSTVAVTLGEHLDKAK